MTPANLAEPPHLDEVAALARADPGGMLAAVASAGDLARRGLAAAQAVVLTGPTPRVVVVAGMGGSGIAGDVLQALALPFGRAPVVTVKHERLPGFVPAAGRDCLVVAVSYSGTTAETCTLARQAFTQGARVVAVTGGGTLGELARQHGAPCVAVPAGLQPRVAFWALAVPVLAAAEGAGLLDGTLASVDAAAAELDRAAGDYAPDVAAIRNPAKQAALRLVGRLPVVWGTGIFGPVAASRFRAQCNENAKVSATSAAFPEAAHNDAQGLEGGLGPGRALVLLRDPPGESPADSAMLAALVGVLAEPDPVRCDAPDGGPPLVRLARLVAFADFAATYLGLARGVDPTPIRTIARAKAALLEAGKPA